MNRSEKRITFGISSEQDSYSFFLSYKKSEIEDKINELLVNAILFLKNTTVSSLPFFYADNVLLQNYKKNERDEDALKISIEMNKSLIYSIEQSGMSSVIFGSRTVVGKRLVFRYLFDLGWWLEQRVINDKEKLISQWFLGGHETAESDLDELKNTNVNTDVAVDAAIEHQGKVAVSAAHSTNDADIGEQSDKTNILRAGGEAKRKLGRLMP